VRIQKARRYRMAHFLVTTGWKEKLIHQKEVKATHKLETIEGEMSQDKERKGESKGHSLPREYKGRDCQNVENKKVGKCRALTS
jgi:hypothetical protein